MNRIITLIGILMFCGEAFAQKVYVWDPQPEVPVQRPLFTSSDTVDIIIFDGRSIPKKSNNKFTSEELIEVINNNIKEAYEGAVFNHLDKNEYYKEVKNKHVTIKIGISGYHAGFGRDIGVAIGNVGGKFKTSFIGEGKWNSITSFYVKVYDFRDNNSIVEEQEIISLEERPNLGGYSTARKALRSTYNQSMNKLFSFIDSVLMK